MSHILLVEDEDGLRITLKRALEKAGHEVTACVDGIDVDQALDNDGVRPELVLTDFSYPTDSDDAGGLYTAKKMHEIDSNVPVLLMSAEIKNLPSKVTDHFDNRSELLEKPVRPEVCVEMVNRYLAKKTP